MTLVEGKGLIHLTVTCEQVFDADDVKDANEYIQGTLNDLIDALKRNGFKSFISDHKFNFEPLEG